ncbi:MAG: ferredoxin:protochlorophyllide reductase (ATP-dependent) subunit B, partial [Burkholderiales bacterium]
TKPQQQSAVSATNTPNSPPIGVVDVVATVTATARSDNNLAGTPTAANGPWVAVWDADAEKELGKIPFFVRGKARRNTERFAQERAVAPITVETLYDAKAHFGR